MRGGNMKFIDRKREMSTLEKEYNRENSFVVYDYFESKEKT